jgi:hypothetical protein
MSDYATRLPNCFNKKIKHESNKFLSQLSSYNEFPNEESEAMDSENE